MTYRLKTRLLKPAETAVVRERPCKRYVRAVYGGDRGNATVEEL
jgi:hypothetical protein